MTTKLIAADASAGAILDPSVGDGTLVIQTGLAGAKVDAISIAADGTPTFLKVPNNTAAQSMIRLHTSNGYGSTNTCILRLTTTVTNQGVDITYVDSAALGASFTINASGVYAVSACYANAAAGGQFGISLNTTQPTTPIATISAPDRLCAATCGASSGLGLNVSTVVYLPAGSVIRPHADTGASGLAAFSSFTITRVA